MKGISIAIETVIYLILGVTVLSILLWFFLSQAGPAQDQYTLEAQRQRFCGSYVSVDFRCEGDNDKPKDVGEDVLKGIAEACSELKRRFGLNYPSCTPGSASLACIQECCITCPQR